MRRAGRWDHVVGVWREVFAEPDVVEHVGHAVLHRVHAPVVLPLELDVAPVSGQGTGRESKEGPGHSTNYLATYHSRFRWMYSHPRSA